MNKLRENAFFSQNWKFIIFSHFEQKKTLIFSIKQPVDLLKSFSRCAGDSLLKSFFPLLGKLLILSSFPNFEQAMFCFSWKTSAELSVKLAFNVSKGLSWWDIFCLKKFSKCSRTFCKKRLDIERSVFGKVDKTNFSVSCRTSWKKGVFFKKYTFFVDSRTMS